MPEINFNSKEYIDALKRGDSYSQVLLVNKYNPSLRKFAKSKGVFFDALDEVVQRTWLSFFDGVHRFQHRSHIRVFLFGIMKNKVKEYWRELTRDKIFDTEEVSEVPYEMGASDFFMNPHDHFLYNDFISRLERYSVLLSENQKRILFTFLCGGDMVLEANRLNLSMTNRRVILSRARKIVRECLQYDGFQERD